MPDVIVIGSGFGGSIAAKRFTQAGKSVSIIELGERWDDPAKLQQSQDTKFILRLFRDYPVDYLQAKPKLVVTQGMGFGGGSLVYSGIHLRAPVSAFSGWPAGYTRANLDPFYSRVEQRLNVQTMQDTFSFRRPSVFAQGAAAAGLPAPVANPLAMTNCVRCGWCVPICKWGRKNTMAHTYLADALATGRLAVYTNRKVKYIAKYGTRYRVVYWKTDTRVDNYHIVNSGSLYYQEADTVVIAGGSIESPVLLQRSMSEALPTGYTRINAFSTTYLGKRIDGTGDFAVGGFVPQQVDTYKGAIMMANIDRGDYILEDLHAIPVGPAVKLEAAFTIGGRDRTWGVEYKQRYRDYGRNMMLIGVIGKSPSGSNMSVTNDNGNAKLSTTAYAPPPNSLEEAARIITSLGGTVGKGPWERSGTAATVHPTGGCPMASVVRPTDLQVYNNPGLYVVDGSVLPGTVMRNPSNTIAAVAEKAMDVILGVPGAPTW